MEVDMFASIAAKDAGIARVMNAADDDWKQSANAQIDVFLQNVPHGRTFIGEEIRIFALLGGCGNPHHHNAWGGAIGSRIRSALKSGEIEICGLGSSDSTKSHARLQPRYRKAVQSC